MLRENCKNRSESGQALTQFFVLAIGIIILVILAMALVGSPYRPNQSAGAAALSGEVGSVTDDVISGLEALAPVTLPLGHPVEGLPAFGTLDGDISLHLQPDDINFEAGHGKTKHKEDAERIQECLTKQVKGGTFQAFIRPGTNRYIFPCEVAPGEFGVQVVDEVGNGKYDSVTAFIKEIIKSWDDMIQYLDDSNVVPTNLP